MATLNERAFEVHIISDRWESQTAIQKPTGRFQGIRIHRNMEAPQQ
jgi:hypothetical protein